ncbi:MAG: FkbM family methyltransferase [Cyanobium sp. D14.bin.5]|jgi:FkbM family methyltransferase|nr:FkbM family methyltransferase [Cyanobium sp. D14.bin.5]
MIFKPMKSMAKQIVSMLGYEVCRMTPSSSACAQIVSALKLVEADTVFDIGANAGQFASYIRNASYMGEIVSFEPLDSARISLAESVKRDRRWMLHERCAIGDYDGEVEINVAGNSVSSSVLSMHTSHAEAALGSAYVSSEKVPIKRLDGIASQYLNHNSKLFIKIDTQGFEWQVLDGAAETLRRAQGLICELSLIPLYEGQKLWRDVIDRLDQEGFMLWALQKGFTDPRTGQSLQMDGIFLRRDVLKS